MGNSKAINKKVLTPKLVSKQVNSRLSRHCIATIVVKHPNRLLRAEDFTEYLSSILVKQGVQCIGEVVHEFNNHSFTTVVALAESHISVHTWPERLAVQLDVFLCNYMHKNTQKCEDIFESIIDYFDPIEVERIYIDRL